MSDQNGSGGWILYVSKPTGYDLRPRDGDLPEIGDVVEEDGVRLRVSKHGPSPIPGDRRRVAYTQGA